MNPNAFNVSHRQVFAIALPMTLAYLSTPLLGTVDTAVVGRLGDAALLGGLAVGAILFDLVFTTFNFLRSGTTGLTAQALGAGDDKEQQAVFFRALIVALVGGLLCIGFGKPLLHLGIYLMQPTQGVAQATLEYGAIRLFSSPFALANYVILGWLLGLGRAGLGLLLQTILNGSNIVLSIYLGLHLQLGISGVAWATVIGESIAMVVGLLIVWRIMRPYPPSSARRIFDRTKIFRTLSLNRDLLIRSFVLLFAFVFFTAQGSRFGETTLAANAVLMNFFMMGGFLLDGFATAAEQLAGRAIGANYRPAFDRTVRLTLIWGFLFAIVLCATFWLAGPWLIALLTTNPEVQQVANTYLIWAALTTVYWCAGISNGWYFHRLNLVKRHAQHDVGVNSRVPNHMVASSAAMGESRFMASAGSLFRHSWHHPALAFAVPRTTTVSARENAIKHA